MCTADPACHLENSAAVEVGAARGKRSALACKDASFTRVEGSVSLPVDLTLAVNTQIYTLKVLLNPKPQPRNPKPETL